MIKYRILAVDDDPDVLDFIQAALSSKYEVIKSLDGEEALMKFKECEPDLVLLDAMMPGLSGYEVCNAIRKIQDKGAVPIIMLSALDSVEDHKAGYHEGVNFYLTKPIPPDRLQRNIEVQLSSSGPPKAKKLTLDQIESRKKWVEIKSTPILKPAPVKTTPQPLKTVPATPARPRILVVDDDLDILNILKLLFKKDFELICTDNGIDALRMVTAYQPDLVILDIILPKVNGFQICTAIRKLDRYKDMPIIFLTGKDDPKLREMGESFDALYILKPINAKFLTQKVRELLLNSPVSTEPKQYSFEEICKIELSMKKESKSDKKK